MAKELPSILHTRLRAIQERAEELGLLLSQTNLSTDLLRKYSKELAAIEPTIVCYTEYTALLHHIAQTQTLLNNAENDKELQELAQLELTELTLQTDNKHEELIDLLLPSESDDQQGVYLEIRAAAGGDESSLFTGVLSRMYTMFADNKKWKCQVVSASPGTVGGFKDIYLEIEGVNVYGTLKFESGVHRVQRVPITEGSGRIHTSTCTVAVIPKPESLEEITIRSDDLKVDTFRSSGAGGQHVNKTESAIRITHIPSGLVVECQEERSQHKNRAKAMNILAAQLNALEREKAAQQQASARRTLVGSGDRSERIRTYNYQQARITDHRINYSVYNLEEVLNGAIEELLHQLQIHERQLKLDDLAKGLG